MTILKKFARIAKKKYIYIYIMTKIVDFTNYILFLNQITKNELKFKKTILHFFFNFLTDMFKKALKKDYKKFNRNRLLKRPFSKVTYIFI
jgi:hypothetical protein